MSLPSTPSRPRTPLLLFLDFDGTLTEHETTATLAALPPARASGEAMGDATTDGGAAAQGRDDEETTRGSRSEGHDNGASRAGTGTGKQKPHRAAERRNDFVALTVQYICTLQFHRRSYIPPPDARATVAQELAWLESLRSVEEASVARVEASGFFAGLTRETIWEGAFEAVRGGGGAAGEGVQVRPFARECVQRVLSRRGGIQVVSVNWSRTWIRGILAAAFGDGFPAVSAPMLEDWPFVDVAANELDGSGKIQGWNGRRILTAGDKVRVVRKIIEERGEEEGGCRSIYVGDSVTDLGALLEVDVGVCLWGDGMGGFGGDQSGISGTHRELMGVLERCGIGCEWIGGWRGRIRRQGKRLWWARGFEEVWESGVLSEEWEGSVDGEEIGVGNPPREMMEV